MAELASVRNRHARRLFAPLGPSYDRYAVLLSLGQDPRWRRFLVSRVDASPRDRVLDVAGRDHCRTPMQWSSEPGAGFSPAGVEPWLPLGDFAACNVADQRDDPRSVLSFCRRLIALRRELADLRDGAYLSLDAPPGVWAWRRGGSTSVAVNLSDEHAAVRGLTGRVALGTGPARDREPVTGSLALSPWEGVVLSEPPR